MKNKEHLFLEDEDWRLLISILSAYPCTVYAFGSRTKTPLHKFSDIDLCVDGEINLHELRDKFAESNLPMKVDIKHLHDLSPEFLEMIRGDLVMIQEKN